MAKQKKSDADAFFTPLTKDNVVRSDIGNKNMKEGTVVSAKASKTITIAVERRVMHPLYHRIIQMRKKFYAHDEFETARMGDVVRIVECRPLSKTKKWRLVESLRRANATPPVERAENH